MDKDFLSIPENLIAEGIHITKSETGMKRTRSFWIPETKPKPQIIPAKKTQSSSLTWKKAAKPKKDEKELENIENENKRDDEKPKELIQEQKEENKETQNEKEVKDNKGNKEIQNEKEKIALTSQKEPFNSEPKEKSAQNAEESYAERQKTTKNNHQITTFFKPKERESNRSKHEKDPQEEEKLHSDKKIRNNNEKASLKTSLNKKSLQKEKTGQHSMDSFVTKKNQSPIQKQEKPIEVQNPNPSISMNQTEDGRVLITVSHDPLLVVDRTEVCQKLDKNYKYQPPDPNDYFHKYSLLDSIEPSTSFSFKPGDN